MKENKGTPRILIFTFIVCLALIGFFNLKISFPAFFSIGSEFSKNSSLLVIFLTGLMAGGLSCMAVQGGLLAATIAEREEERLKEKVKEGTVIPILAFLGSKIIAYTILGLLLGWFGSFFNLSLNFKIFMQVAVAIFMIGTACNILNAHPVFRYFVIQPPKFLTRLVRRQSKSKDIFAPILLGAFTVFIPCGVTQAIMAIAIASGSPLSGAGILFAFVLGTSPVFFLLGYFMTKLGDSLQQKFMRFTAIAIILLAVFNLNNAIALTGSNFTLDNLWKFLFKTAYGNIQTDSIREATIIIGSMGYSPSVLTVRTGDEITLHVKNVDGYGCIQSFTIPGINFQKVIPPGTSQTITFRTGAKGQIPFMCSMGMFRGVINVI